MTSQPGVFAAGDCRRGPVARRLGDRRGPRGGPAHRPVPDRQAQRAAGPGPLASGGRVRAAGRSRILRSEGGRDVPQSVASVPVPVPDAGDVRPGRRAPAVPRIRPQPESLGRALRRSGPGPRLLPPARRSAGPAQLERVPRPADVRRPGVHQQGHHLLGLFRPPGHGEDLPLRPDPPARLRQGVGPARGGPGPADPRPEHVPGRRLPRPADPQGGA